MNEKTRILNKGKLWDKYTNLCKGKPKPKKELKEKPKTTSADSTDSNENEISDNESETARIYLLYNFERNELVKKKWQDCFEYRKRKFNKSNIEEILEEWPIITKTIGPELVKQF